MTEPKVITGLDKWLDSDFGNGNNERFDAWLGAMHLLEVARNWYDSTDFNDLPSAAGALQLVNFLKTYCGRERNDRARGEEESHSICS